MKHQLDIFKGLPQGAFIGNTCLDKINISGYLGDVFAVTR